MSQPTATITINLDALVSNYRALCSMAASGTCAAVVKADAYGLGVVPVARALAAAACREFFVADVNEGVALRAVLPSADFRIHVFEGVDDASAEATMAANLWPVLNSDRQIDCWQRTARRVGRELPCTLHVDTGMNRLGMPAHDALTRAGRADGLHGLALQLLITHLACADDPANPMNAAQLRAFGDVTAAFGNIRTSIANSGGLMMAPEYHGDLPRPGIAMYGGNPQPGQDSPFRTVVTMTARVLQTRQVAAGATVGYGASYCAPGTRTLATLAAGYADGYPRALSNRGWVAISGHRAPVVGRVSMDTTVVDITDLPLAVSAGLDVAELIGTTISLDSVARWADSINYAVLTGLGRRPDRRYSLVAEGAADR
ncbi:MAG: alanine racemase [Gammaproteobacteria bacterium]|nr:alanine racemase [Gammaproteobacteria bacterium]